MGKKYLDTKQNTLEAAVMKVWQVAAEEMDPVNPKAARPQNKDIDNDDDRKDKDIDNDGDVDELMSIFIKAAKVAPKKKQSVKR